MLAVVAGATVALTTSTERTFLIGDSFGADTAIAWCTTVAVVAFLAAHLVDLHRRRARDDRAAGLLVGLWLVALVPVAAIVVALAWFSVDSYTTTVTGSVIRTQPGFLKTEQLYYDRVGVVLILTDRSF